MCYYHETKCPQHQCLLEPVSPNWLHIYPTGVFLTKQIKVLNKSVSPVVQSTSPVHRLYTAWPNCVYTHYCKLKVIVVLYSVAKEGPLMFVHPPSHQFCLSILQRYTTYPKSVHLANWQVLQIGNSYCLTNLRMWWDMFTHATIMVQITHLHTKNISGTATEGFFER